MLEGEDRRVKILVNFEKPVYGDMSNKQKYNVRETWGTAKT